MSKHLTVVDTQAEVKEASKNLDEPFVILVKDGNKLVYQDDSHCDAVLLIDDWNNYHAEIPVIQKDISWVKGRRCLVKKTDEGVAICYLDENNSELFHDGTTPAKLDGSMGQWMTDLPEFSYSCTEGESDWVKLHINKELTLENKSRRVLVGVTGAVNRNGKLWSCKYPLGSTSSLTSTGNLNAVTFYNYAKALGEGFDITDYETYCKIAYMFMTKYKNKDPRKIFGSCGNGYDNPIGATSIIGNKDGGQNLYTSLFGIENYYGGQYQVMGGIHQVNTLEGGLIYYIYDGFEPDKIPTVPYRTINKNYISDISLQGYISRLEWGDHADIIPTELSGTSKYFYNDLARLGGDLWHIICHGDYQAQSPDWGLFSLLVRDSTYSDRYMGARIQYRGKIEVIEDPQEFIALPVGM